MHCAECGIRKKKMPGRGQSLFHATDAPPMVKGELFHCTNLHREKKKPGRPRVIQTNAIKKERDRLRKRASGKKKNAKKALKTKKTRDFFKGHDIQRETARRWDRQYRKRGRIDTPPPVLWDSEPEVVIVELKEKPYPDRVREAPEYQTDYDGSIDNIEELLMDDEHDIRSQTYADF